ncbi:hypothetical protein LTR37_012886 [Vermiconidia calcicola]|uniref:Uncharacterized protein n=1 Tax=Vermiconidia calcicola TaxID=1690605 RepID=A0ACC3MY31_9PEZI|nr:hypothetical protein LTR37_012886 [Vermiconidia calcicola]
MAFIATECGENGRTIMLKEATENTTVAPKSSTTLYLCKGNEYSWQRDLKSSRNYEFATSGNRESHHDEANTAYDCLRRISIRGSDRFAITQRDRCPSLRYSYTPLPSPRIAYKYASLNDPSWQIRLLILKPAHGLSTDIYGSLYTGDFQDDVTVYYALSYTWGDNHRTNFITIDGRILPITANLYGALLRLRGSQSRTLWIDAICINQDDDYERSAQVSVMRQIYERAEHVVIWLGEESVTEDGRISMEFLASIDWETAKKRYYKLAETKHPGHCTNTPDNDAARERHSETMARAKQLCTVEGAVQAFNATRGAEDRLTIENLNKFLARPWFSRRWVIQEVCVAKQATTICGTNYLPWPMLVQALDSNDYQCQERNSNIAVALLHAAKWMEFDESHVNPRGILEVMFRFENFACRDSRDLIGAVLSLWPSLGYRIDYSLDCTTNYFLFAKSLVDAGWLINVLDSALLCRQRPGIDDPTLPTWVPDWRRLGSHNDGHRDNEDIVSGNGFKIDPTNGVLLASVTTRRTVAVKGVMVGSVDYGSYRTSCDYGAYRLLCCGVFRARIAQLKGRYGNQRPDSSFTRELENLDRAVKGGRDPEDVIALLPVEYPRSLLPGEYPRSLYILRRKECKRERYKVVAKPCVGNLVEKWWWEDARPRARDIEIT